MQTNERPCPFFWAGLQRRRLYFKVKGVGAASPLSPRIFSCAIFRAPQMFMNNVHRSPLEVRLEEEEEEEQEAGEGEGQMNYT